ncbi:MAG: hypothetical protein AAGJ84_13655 [Pseudomonadota bacterium]
MQHIKEPAEQAWIVTAAIAASARSEADTATTEAMSERSGTNLGHSWTG